MKLYLFAVAAGQVGKQQDGVLEFVLLRLLGHRTMVATLARRWYVNAIVGFTTFGVCWQEPCTGTRTGDDAAVHTALLGLLGPLGPRLLGPLGPLLLGLRLLGPLLGLLGPLLGLPLLGPLLLGLQLLGPLQTSTRRMAISSQSTRWHERPMPRR